MTTTRAYKNVRLITHFFTLLIFVCNIILAVHFLAELRFFQVESSLNLGLFDMQVCIKYTIIISTMLAFFSACSITSKFKFYMKMYLIVGFIGICFLMAFIVFLLGPYISIFETQFPMQFGSNASIRYQIRMLLKCGEAVSNDCITVAKEKVQTMIKTFMFFGITSFVLTIITYIMTRIAMYVDISEPSRRIVPRIERNVQMGYDAESLRNKRFIEPDLRFNATIMDTKK